MMKRYLLPFLILLTLSACSRKEPTPTSTVPPTLLPSRTPLAQFTPTARGSPVARITIVPSATRLPPTPELAAQDTRAAPTRTVAPLATAVPSATPTPQIIDAGATDTPTPTPTATLPQSPLQPPGPGTGPTATATPSPLAEGATPLPSSTSSPDATATPTSTPTATLEGAAAPSATPTPTLTPTPEGEAWYLRGLYTYYDEDFHEFYVWGEVVNRSAIYQRVTSLMPVVNDAEGEPVTSEEDVEPLPGYDSLRELVSLKPEQSLAFSFLIYLPTGVPFSNNYDIQVQVAAAEPYRDDMDIPLGSDTLDTSEWPVYAYVDGYFVNPGPDLTEYVAVVITLYDLEEHVIGLGWLVSIDPAYLATGQQSYAVEVESWDIVGALDLEVGTYKIQVFGQ
jgi:hypothetical protein